MFLFPSQTGKVNTVKTVIEWEIENVCFVNKNVGEVLSSSEFSIDNMRWQLKIYPNGCTQTSEGQVSIALQSLNQEKYNELILVISFLNYHNKRILFCTEWVSFTEETSLWKFEKLMKYDEFLSKLNHVSPDNKLKIKCEFLPKTSNYFNVLTHLNFESFFNADKHSDVKFSVKGKILYAHKIILSNKSQVFAAMFEHPMKENLENSVDVEDIEYEVFTEMLRFIYSERVMNMKNNVKNLLFAAEKYAIDDLKFICGKYLCDNLSIDNVVEYFELADMYKVKELRTRTINFILSNAKILIDVPSFKSIVDLRGDLVFEVFRCLVENQTIKNKSKATEVQNIFKDVRPVVPSFGFPPSALTLNSSSLASSGSTGNTASEASKGK